MGFYYYLTRDPEVLPDLIAVKEYVMGRYWNPDLGVLQWQLADTPGGARAAERRITATLDQMNAYMALLAPIVPEPEAQGFRRDLGRLSNMLMGEYYQWGDNLFFTSATTARDKDLTEVTVDFGHTIKSFWMIRWAGLISGQPGLVEFAEEWGPRVLERAFLEDGTWANAVTPRGLDRNKDWWIYAELDQFAATMALKDPSLARYLVRTYDYWLRVFVDPKYGEVWNTVDGATHQPVAGLPKQWPWKNGYHSMEHALVAYITTAQLHGQSVALYYSFVRRPDEALIRPYFFTGDVRSVEADTIDGTPVNKVWFTGIR